MDLLRIFCTFIPRILCIIYGSYKLLNLKMPTGLQKLFYIIFAVFMMIPICLSEIYFRSAIATVLAMGIFFMFMAVTHTEAGLSFATVLMSLGITYGLHLITSMLIATACSPFLDSDKAETFYFQLIGALITCLLMYLLFKIKRLRKGMPFLRNLNARLISSIVGAVILICMTIINGRLNNNYFHFIPVLVLFICSVFILIWWRSRITKTYIEMLKNAERKVLEEDLKEKTAKNAELEKDNQMLSTLIHKDNKLIPSLVLSVQELILASDQLSKEELKLRGQELLQRLDEIAGDRAGVVKEYSSKGRKLLQTGHGSIDAVLSYMDSKAATENIAFDVAILSELSGMSDSISENDLNTLLADLAENALIAARHGNSPKKVIVSMGGVSGHFMLSVFDSGEPFDGDVLLSMGQKRITTHKDDGGSGIGLMTVTEIANKYKASLAIEELDGKTSQNTGYKKRVSVIFDGKCKYILKTANNAEIRKRTQRTDIIFIDM